MSFAITLRSTESDTLEYKTFNNYVSGAHVVDNRASFHSMGHSIVVVALDLLFKTYQIYNMALGWPQLFFSVKVES